MARKKKESPALQLVLHVWASSCKAAPHSWERLNHTMADAVKIAITGGLEFEAGDFNVIEKECRPGYWLYIESAYATAVSTRNQSAYKAIEHYLGREPIIADGVSGRGRGRLAEGCTFDYQGLRPTVTSFRNGYVVACTYKPNNEDEYRSKVDRRFTLTREDIIADRADQKERV